MPFNNNTVLPVLPKPDHAKSGMAENLNSAVIEDKELRKKLRNRQSALAARERKKARMMELERQVAELQEINRRIDEDNQHLRARLDTVMRKCADAGLQLDSDQEFMKTYGIRPAVHMNYPGHQVVYPGMNTANTEPNRAATLRMEIKELGERQQELLQAMPYGTFNGRPHMQTNNPMMMGDGTCNYPGQRMPIKQEYGRVLNSALQRSSCSSFAANFHNFNQLTPETMQQASLPLFRTKRPHDIANMNCPAPELSDPRNQSLPSIAAVLGSPAKRPCVEATHCQQTDSYLPTSASAVHTEGSCVPPAYHQPGLARQNISVSQQPSVISTYANNSNECIQHQETESKSQRADANVRSPEDFRSYPMNSDVSPFLASGEKLVEELSNTSGHSETDQVLPFFDFQDFMSGDLTADSPSALSASDSGVSMDDSLDWIAENPIFDL